LTTAASFLGKREEGERRGREEIEKREGRGEKEGEG